MERKTLAIGVGVGMLGVAGVGLGAVIRAKRRGRRESGADLRRRASASERGRGAPASFSGDIRGAQLPAPDLDAPRTATRMAPGIPVGSGQGIDRALTRPDTDIGGGVTGDTTVTGAEGEKGRDERTIRNEDHERTTL